MLASYLTFEPGGRERGRREKGRGWRGGGRGRRGEGGGEEIEGGGMKRRLGGRRGEVEKTKACEFQSHLLRLTSLPSS